VSGKELSIHMRTLPIVWGQHLVRTSCGIGITDIDTLWESLWYDL
jgi:hypothetical protein